MLNRLYVCSLHLWTTAAINQSQASDSAGISISITYSKTKAPIAKVSSADTLDQWAINISTFRVIRNSLPLPGSGSETRPKDRLELII